MQYPRFLRDDDRHGNRTLIAVGALALLAYGWSRCQVKVPSDIEPVEDFDVEQYMGTWYELARIDHIFERGLVNAKAQYSLNDDGSVRVVNRGFNPETGRWKQSQGTARFLGDPSVAALKVSFFGPFYGGYNVVHLDDDISMVIGQNLDYFWLLSRHREIEPEKMDELLALAQSMGVDTRKVIQVPQDAD
jgi:apolipoprotein D and lipocalin family protein